MLHFQARPDRVFLAIVHEALQHSREELDFTPTYTPTREDHETMDEHYRVLYPELARFFEREVLVEVLSARADPGEPAGVEDRGGSQT